MIPDKDVAKLITTEVPELKPRVFSPLGIVSIYQNIGLLSDLTVLFIQQHNLRSLAKCFHVAERLLKEGSQTTKNAIENVFVYSVTTRTEGNLGGLREVLWLLPPKLKAEYNREIGHFG